MENKILNNTQLSFLDEAGKSDFIKDNFYLTGGTALAAFYLGHRYSEDLDFFSEKEVDSLATDVFIKQIQEAKDFPRMITELELGIWQNFFVEEAKKLKSEIITED